MAERSIADQIGWAHRLIAEILPVGGRGVDLTAGTGQDTLFLAKGVGPAGEVFSFDIQEEALRRTGETLDTARIGWSRSAAGPVRLIHDSHERLDQYVSGAIDVLIANLGYLPGGDKSIVTTASSTLHALKQGLDLLRPGGRAAVVVYPGHEGGAEEAEAVVNFFTQLNPREWQVLRLAPLNRTRAPFLLVAERSGEQQASISS